MMHQDLIFWILGRLLLGFAGVMLLPLLLAMVQKEATVSAWVATVAITGAMGLTLFKAGNQQPRLGVKESFAVVAGGWLATSLCAALPYYWSGTLPAFIDALFEAVSGLTTTGASVIDNLQRVPKSILLWRSMTQWLGGMGIIVLFIVFLPNAGAGAAHLFRAEVTGPTKEKVMPRIRDTALVLWLIYVSLTVAAGILLLLAGMEPFDAVNHALATAATGGFSTSDAGIRQYNNPAIELILIVFMILAGGNFAVYYLAWTKGFRALLTSTELRVYLLIIGAATLAISANLILVQDLPWSEAIRQSLFQAASITTTTGFANVDYEGWPPFAQLILLILMFIGGCSGSTSGGIKVARVIVLIKQAWITLKRALHPRAVISVVVDGKNVDMDVVSAVMQFFVIYMFTFAVGVVLLGATGLPPLDTISAIASALSSVGTAFGMAGPMGTYTFIPPFGKLVLIGCMLLGRLEFITLLVMLQPEFWRSAKQW